MKGKQLAIILGLVVLVGGIALLLSRRHSAEWSSSATSTTDKILNFPLNDVTHMTLRGGGAELNLVKKNDLWTVRERTDYRADFDKVSALLRKLWELHPVQDVKIGPSQLGRLQLGEPGGDPNSSGTLIDLKGTNDQRLSALLLGKTFLRNSEQVPGQNGFPVGRYVMTQDGANRVFLIGETMDDAQTKPEQWLSHDFVKVEGPKLVAVAGTNPGMNWTLTRESPTTPWKLTDAKAGEEFDVAKVSGLANLFASAGFVDVLAPDAPVAETGLDKSSTARLETFDNFVYEFRIGKLMGENYPVQVSVKADLPKERTPAADEKPEDKAKFDQEFQARQKQLAEKLEKEQELGTRPYLIPKTTIEQLLKERSALMAEKKPSPSPSPTVASAPSPTAGKPQKPASSPSPGSPPSPAKRPK